MEIPVAPQPAATVYVPEPGGNKLFSKRNILVMLFLLVIVIALPVGVYLVQKTQIFKSKATVNISGTFTFAPEMAVKDPNDTTGLQYVSRKRGSITMQIKSDADVEPFLAGAGAGATPIPTVIPAPAVTPTPVPVTTATPAVTPKPPSVVKVTGMNAICGTGAGKVTLTWDRNYDYPNIWYTYAPENTKNDPATWSPWATTGSTQAIVSFSGSNTQYTWVATLNKTGGEDWYTNGSFNCP